MQLGYFQVIAEPVSTWVHEIFELGAAAGAALGDEVVDAAAALGVARVPVLHGRVFDLRVVDARSARRPRRAAGSRRAAARCSLRDS